MAMRTWRVDNDENAKEQERFNQTEEGRRLKEEAERLTGNSADKVVLNATAFGKLNTSDTTALRYPKHADITSTSDYVAFEFFAYKPPFGTKEGKGNRRNEYDASANFSGEDILGEAGSKVLLFMPEDIQAEYGANWGGVGFGLLPREILKGAAGDFDLGRSIEAGIGAAKRRLVDTIVEAGNNALGTGVTTNQAIGGTTGRVVNPNVEMMYESPEMRGFSLNFKMFSSNEIESNEIRRICNTFKKNMLPKFGNAFIEVPNVVRVSFMTGNSPNQFVSQFKPCAITNVSINYTPDGAWATYRDGRPVATQLTIQFKELKMLFADDIKLEGESY